MKCSHCGAEFEGNFCTACGAKAEPCPQPSPEIPADRPRSQKPKKPIYKKWWFYVIVAVGVIAIAGRISGGSKSEKIDWDDMVLGAQLPQPPAKKGQIHTNTADELWVDIEKTSDKQYADYVQACQTVGFTVDAESNSSSFSAYNAEGYKRGGIVHPAGKADGDGPHHLAGQRGRQAAARTQIPDRQILF